MRRLSFVVAPLLCAARAFALTCGACHTAQAQTQPETPMAQAMALPATDETLKTHPNLATQAFGYAFSVARNGDQSIYSVSDGKQTISAPISWAFGQRSQTFVVEYQGLYYETLVTYFPGIQTLDVTPGDNVLHPQSLQEAFGRPLLSLEVQRCVNCHSTGGVVNHQLNVASMHPGIACARCHTAAEAHFEAITNAKLTPLPPRLKQLSAENVSNFCGQCHRSWQDVIREHLFGQLNVRFQPYRLALSKCFDGVDARMSCIACHDPHKVLVRDGKSYDPNCLACHSAGAKLSAGMIAAHPAAKSMPVCPVAKDNCVSCHMPKTPLTGAHVTFTDHDIRVAKPGETYPD